jgi:GNAT superfamily N-acetyltransferase
LNAAARKQFGGHAVGRLRTNYLESGASFSADQIGLDPDQSPWFEMLQDSTMVAMRPMTENDAGAERTFTEALAPRLRRLRFHGQLVCPFMTQARQFEEIGQGRTIAFAAFIPEGQNESILGFSSYSTNSTESSCTCDVAVLDEWHRRGLGSMLMKHLIEIARGKGIDYMFGADSVQNAPMIELAKRLGFSQQIDPRDRSRIVHGLWL